MDKISCYIVKDLMPLYVDEVVSEETAQAVRGHLDQCESCRKEFQMLSKQLSVPSNSNIQEENGRALKRFKWKLMYQKFAISCFSVLLTLVLLGGVFLVGRDMITEMVAGHSSISKHIDMTHRQNSDDWETLKFEDGDSLVMDWLFCQKEVVNDSDNTGNITFRFRDADGEVVIDEVTVEPGKKAFLEELKLKTEYTVEVKAAPGVYRIVFT